MKNRKRLNNKGFTLIELLAVVVILAVVMGIAMSSVLTSMNSSRKGSLQNSAESTAQIFQNKYAESMVTGGTSSVFGQYDFTVATATAPTIYPLTKSIGSDLNLAQSAYSLADTADALTDTDADGDIDAADSFVVFNGDKIVACLVAENSGSYYVGQAAKVTEVTILNQKIVFADGTMFACSDEQTSWTE